MSKPWPCPVCNRPYTERKRRTNGGWSYRHYFQEVTWCKANPIPPTPLHPETTGDVQRRALNWITSGDTGISSTTIWAVMMGAEINPRSWHFGHPHDPDDFSRCHALLELIPEWRPRLREVADVFPSWSGLVDEWDTLTKLFLSKQNHIIYDRMQALIEEAETRLHQGSGQKEGMR